MPAEQSCLDPRERLSWAAAAPLSADMGGASRAEAAEGLARLHGSNHDWRVVTVEGVEEASVEAPATAPVVCRLVALVPLAAVEAVLAVAAAAADRAGS